MGCNEPRKETGIDFLQLLTSNSRCKKVKLSACYMAIISRFGSMSQSTQSAYGQANSHGWSSICIPPAVDSPSKQMTCAVISALPRKCRIHAFATRLAYLSRLPSKTPSHRTMIAGADWAFTPSVRFTSTHPSRRSPLVHYHTPRVLFRQPPADTRHVMVPSFAETHGTSVEPGKASAVAMHVHVHVTRCPMC